MKTKQNHSQEENYETNPFGLLRLTLLRVEKVFLALGVICVHAILVITSLDVIFRYFLNHALGWAFDTSAVLMVGIVFLSLAHVQSQKGHVAVGIIISRLPPNIRSLLPFLHGPVGIFAFALIGWKASEHAIEAVRLGWVYGLQVAIPMWIPYATIAVGSFLLCLRLFLEILLSIFRESKT
jgi:TRAP-type C4-dicarboxylate transport system permease small subunit